MVATQSPLQSIEILQERAIEVPEVEYREVVKEVARRNVYKSGGTMYIQEVTRMWSQEVGIVVRVACLQNDIAPKRLWLQKQQHRKCHETSPNKCKPSLADQDSLIGPPLNICHPD